MSLLDPNEIEALLPAESASFASPIAETVSGETSTSTGMTSWKASASEPSFTVMRTRARPVVRPAA